jgi:hypothetical protein
MFVGVSGSIHIRGRVVCEQDSQDRKGDETIKLDDAESESAPVHTSRSDVDLSQLPDSEVTLQWLEDQLRRQAISSNVSLDRCCSCRRREARVERAGRESHHVCTGFETGGVDSWMGGRVKGRGSVEDVQLCEARLDSMSVARNMWASAAIGRRWFVLEKLWAASALRITTTFCNKKFVSTSMSRTMDTCEPLATYEAEDLLAVIDSVRATLRPLREQDRALW